MEILAANDEGSMHLGRDNGACENTTADRNLAGEGALLICNPNFSIQHTREAVFLDSTKSSKYGKKSSIPM